jgi:hypothetical protein
MKTSLVCSLSDLNMSFDRALAIAYLSGISIPLTSALFINTTKAFDIYIDRVNKGMIVMVPFLRVLLIP